MTAVSFGDFTDASPDIAARIRARLETTGLATLGTVRADGSPRVSPIEISLQDRDLYVGMMPESRKSRDLLCDPCCALLTPLADKHDMSGEGKLFATSRALTDRAEADAVLARAVEGTDIDPAVSGDSPVFELLITGAAWQYVEDDTWLTLSWSPDGGVRIRRRSGPTGLPEDVAQD